MMDSVDAGRRPMRFSGRPAGDAQQVGDPSRVGSSVRDVPRPTPTRHGLRPTPPLRWHALEQPSAVVPHAVRLHDRPPPLAVGPLLGRQPGRVSQTFATVLNSAIQAVPPRELSRVLGRWHCAHSPADAADDGSQHQGPATPPHGRERGSPSSVRCTSRRAGTRSSGKG